MINALKNPSFFRPMSRPASPAPNTPAAQVDSTTTPDKATHPLTNKLSLNTFRRPTPTPLTPVPAPSLIQDGTYLEMLSLKFSEAVSKALAQPSGPVNPAEVLVGKRPLPAGRGSTLGSVIASELHAARENAHLRRAIIRTLHRPFSVLVNNLSSILLPLLASPAFLIPPAPSAQLANPNATQIHALGIANFAGELIEVFDKLELGTDNDPRGDGLKSIREGLGSLITKVTTPLIMGIRNELVALVEALESPAKAPSGLKSASGHQHPSIVTMQALMPLYAKALHRYTSSTQSHSSLANLLITVLWKGMVALAHRPDFGPAAPPSPTVPSTSSKKRRGSPPSTTPPTTPPPSRFTLKLPPPSRPASPNSLVASAPAADCRALFNLINTISRPEADNPLTTLAREAVDEAFEGFAVVSCILRGPLCSI
ncbi:hypothetical protein BKA70DRAFT_657270 [Coprinopsis sp. MPI-PUGE-AT-0042]|nr:hypothetical protein BKA70DRAFT_657270 [Coprinopsis sp. MPI-PUGE-AT-0042]